MDLFQRHNDSVKAQFRSRSIQLLVSLRVWSVIILGLHVLAYLLPQDRAWSLWPYTFLPLWLGLLLSGGAGLLVAPPVNQTIQTGIYRLWKKAPGKTYPRRWFGLLALLSLPLFWWGRIRHLAWGDAEILVIGLSHPEQTVIYNWQAPFTVYLHQRLWALLAGPAWGWGVETVYAAVSVVCGGVFVYVLLNLAFEVTDSALERALIAGMALTTGAMQLFFGYVENYTIISVGLMIFLWLGQRSLHGRAPLWLAILALSLTNGFHPSTVCLWPAALYLAWRRYRAGQPAAQLALSLLLPPLIVGNSLLTLMELGDHGLAAFLGDDRPGGGDHIWFVPLFATRTKWERYTMFSLPHLLEWLNEHFLISTFGLATIVMVAVWAWRNRRHLLPFPVAYRYELWFLGLASAGYLLLTWVWNADYGLRKDWDLFAPSAFVYTLFAALLLARFVRDREALGQAAVLVVGVSGLHMISWIYANTHQLNGL
jgi:hypothetical protein